MDESSSVTVGTFQAAPAVDGDSSPGVGACEVYVCVRVCT
jgi:hypothetical protein